ncbi:MAG: hypothetical protein LV480_09130 [Methylacidiphilales bacterium]|nr:hypothetical protein [Candidatus Methylacidiphilales bacterium]
MKRIVLLLALGALTASSSFAQSPNSTNPPPPPPGGGGPHGMLTDAEKQELHKAHDAAFQANPDLASQEKELNQEMDALHKKIDAAMIQADPAVAPILAKMEAGHHHHGGQGAPPPPPSGN